MSPCPYTWLIAVIASLVQHSTNEERRARRRELREPPVHPSRPASTWAGEPTGKSSGQGSSSLAPPPPPPRPVQNRARVPGGSVVPARHRRSG